MNNHRFTRNNIFKIQNKTNFKLLDDFDSNENTIFIEFLYLIKKKKIKRSFINDLNYEEAQHFEDYLTEFHKVGSFDQAFHYLAEDMSRKILKLENKRIFHLSCAGIIGSLVYHLERFPITRLKISRIHLYYLKYTGK